MARDGETRVPVPAAPIGARIVEGELGASAAEQSAAREEAALALLESAAGAFDASRRALEAAHEKALDNIAETAAQIALDIVQEILRNELVAGNYDIAAIAREALRATSDAPGISTIRVNPSDADTLSRIPFRTGTRIESDQAIRRGDVQIQTDQGVLVRDVDACVKSIRERILAEVESC